MKMMKDVRKRDPGESGKAMAENLGIEDSYVPTGTMADDPRPVPDDPWDPGELQELYRKEILSHLLKKDISAEALVISVFQGRIHVAGGNTPIDSVRAIASMLMRQVRKHELMAELAALEEVDAPPSA